MVNKKERIISPSYLYLGQKRSIQKIAKKAALLLPNSYNEYKRLNNKYNIDTNYKVIPNGIDPYLFKKDAEPVKKDANLIICVGRVEGRKNQLNLIKALNNTEYKLIIIGSPSPNHLKYYETCKKQLAQTFLFCSPYHKRRYLTFTKKLRCMFYQVGLKLPDSVLWKQQL